MMKCKSTYCECSESARAACDGRLTHAEMRALYAYPVPPAGVEPEVLARVCKGHVLGWGLTGYLSVEIGTELVDRAHVTRLQAAVDHWSRLWGVAISSGARLEEECETLQSELTKARELFQAIVNWPDGGNRHGQENIKAFVRANQPAPADKGQV